MNIKLKKGPGEAVLEISPEGPVTIEQLLRPFEAELPYTILAAKVDNQVTELTAELKEDCSVEFLDMRTQAANLIYQYSLSLIYLKAIEDVLGRVPVEIQNSLNKGLYTEVKTPRAVTEAQVRAVERRMRQLVERDAPIVKEKVTMEEALEFLSKRGYQEKARLLEKHPEVEFPTFYQLDGYKNFFYGLMVPSTGYIRYFELRKYRRGVILRFPYPSDPNRIPEYVDEKKLCAAFGEAKKWHRLTGVSYLADLNEKIRGEEYKELILLSEALHEKKVAEIADRITKGKKRIILIAGPSSSGKTTFARRLCVQLKVNGLNPLYMGTDDYFVERKDTPLDADGEPNYEDLEAIDIGLFNRNMNDLLAGKKVDLPTFDFIEGVKRYGKRITSITPNQPIVIEGIHALNRELTKYIPDEEKFRIYISPFTQLNMDSHNRIPTTDARMLRRMVRDHLYRGHSARATIADWPKVRKGEDKNIFPFNGEADVLFNSALTYELALLKKHAQPLLEEISRDEPEYSDARRLLRFLNFFEVIEDESIIPNNSILREFIGGSIFADYL
ncbi:nucleoside kinase [bacterium 210820-DFI.6.37]|nr:nucleoside kinase [bacterium 210820-DFI.6.37]